MNPTVHMCLLSQWAGLLVIYCSASLRCCLATSSASAASLLGGWLAGAGLKPFSVQIRNDPSVLPVNRRLSTTCTVYIILARDSKSYDCNLMLMLKRHNAHALLCPPTSGDLHDCITPGFLSNAELRLDVRKTVSECSFGINIPKFSDGLHCHDLSDPNIGAYAWSSAPT